MVMIEIYMPENYQSNRYTGHSFSRHLGIIRFHSLNLQGYIPRIMVLR